MEGANGFDAIERHQCAIHSPPPSPPACPRTIYLGGRGPRREERSRGISARRLAVEKALLAGAPEAGRCAPRSSVGRPLPLVPLRMTPGRADPDARAAGWHVHRTRPIDGRDVLALLAAAATLTTHHGGRAWTSAGPDDDELHASCSTASPTSCSSITLRSALPLQPRRRGSVVAAAVAGEDPGLIQPLMERLEHDLLPRDARGRAAFGVRLHSFEAAVERALRDMEKEADD